jgi:predicted RNA-binding Zn ribbon-like protein
MDLSSYAELAVRLVNTSRNVRDGDGLTGLDAVRALISGVPQLNAPVTRHDVDALRLLRAELREVFSAAARGDGGRAAEVLNELLIQHPVHPQLSGHDGQRWHLHLTESGAVADQYAAGAVMGLAVVVTHDGVDRLGVCEASSCGSVFVRITGDRTRRYCSDRCANRSIVVAN